MIIDTFDFYMIRFIVFLFADLTMLNYDLCHDCYQYQWQW